MSALPPESGHGRNQSVQSSIAQMAASHAIGASARIMSAAFSPIMMVGALVLPPIRVGMTEASTTRRPLDAAHAQVGSTTACSILAHAAGADRMIDRVDALPQNGANIVVAAHVGR